MWTPLRGEFRKKLGRDIVIAGPALRLARTSLDQIQFTRTLVRQQTVSQRVEYEIEANRVTVIDAQGKGTD
ncbi:MAG TPA: hypothetical protein VFR86_19275 [Burkholderiaceae bacterium]|nr:hypothetical protein [Burkholderiaceae bacterium]